MRLARNAGAARFERVAEVDSRIDTTTGEFEMVMASEAEATDGHMLRVAGIAHAETIPLQLDHMRGAADNLGTVSNMRTGRRGGLPVLLGVGQIRLTGEGDALAARRDLVDAIASGAIRGTSLTWDAEPGSVRERMSLPKGHPARVDPEEPNLRRRFGLFFEKSRAIEQSIVALPADRNALIGRAEAAADAASRGLWQVLVERLEAREATPPDPLVDALSRALAAAEQRLRAAGGPPPSRDHARPVPPLDQVLARVLPEVGDLSRRTRLELDAAFAETLAKLTGVAS